jgi:hypothetical protein
MTCGALIAGLCAGARAEIIHVDDHLPGSGDGTSWEKALNSLRAALQIAQAGDEVRIGKGTFRPGKPGARRTATFRVGDGVVVQGGYAGYGAADPDALNPAKYKTILSGDLTADDRPGFANYDDNSYHVVTFINVGSGTELRGVTICGGSADVDRFESVHGMGGGVRIVGSGGPTLVNCAIRKNRAAFLGGGLCALDGSPTLIGCTVRDNMVMRLDSGGGGAYAFEGAFDGCKFINNDAGVIASGGGGLHGQTIWVFDCLFKGNSSSGLRCGHSSIIRACRFIGNGSEDGGGVFIAGQNAAIVDCLFRDNAAASFGGGVYVQPAAQASIVNCEFLANVAYDGLALANRGAVSATNCIFSGHVLGGEGNGTIFNQQGQMALGSSTIAGNQTAAPGSGVLNHSGDCTLVNCIVWGNVSEAGVEASQVFALNGSMAIDFSCVQGWSGSLAGQGTIGANPDFVDANGDDDVAGTPDDDLRLQAGSPCMNIGDGAALPKDDFDLDDDDDMTEPAPVDLDFKARIAGAGVDLGAYERPER